MAKKQFNIPVSNKRKVCRKTLIMNGINYYIHSMENLETK